jgi:hypothetical protein
MRVGVTGHQELGSSETRLWAERRISEIVLSSDVSSGITSLAKGADQLFAAVLATNAIPYEVVIPCSRYIETFATETERREYESFLACARSAVVLPFGMPSEVAFQAAGYAVVDQCDLLLAIWDGRPMVHIGGTADVVSYALSTRRAIVQLDIVSLQTVKLF